MTVIPDVATRTVGADTRRKVLLALTVAFTVRTLAMFKRNEDGYTPQNVWKAVQKTNIPAWVVLYAMLAIASDFDTTRELALAFAILILVAIFLYDGGKFITTIESIVSDEKTDAPTKPKKSAKKKDN